MSYRELYPFQMKELLVDNLLITLKKETSHIKKSDL